MQELEPGLGFFFNGTIQRVDEKKKTKISNFSSRDEIMKTPRCGKSLSGIFLKTLFILLHK